MHLPPRATAHAHHRRLLVGGQSLCRVARAYVEIAQGPGRELVPSQRNLILCFHAVKCDGRCSRFNAHHALQPDCASRCFYHAVKCATTGKLGKALLPKALPMRHRSIREGASEIPLMGTLVIGAGSSAAQLPTAVIRDRIMTYKSPWMTDETSIFQKSDPPLSEM